MISRLATHTRNLTIGCRRFVAAAFLLVALPAHAAGSGNPMYGSIFWVVLWVVVLLVAIFLGYLQQNRMVHRKTAELRRELFERQMAEKELLASDHQIAAVAWRKRSRYSRRSIIGSKTTCRSSRACFTFRRSI